MKFSLPRSRATVVLLASLVLFVVAMGYLIASSVSVRSAAEFDPTTPGRAGTAASGPAEALRSRDTLTIDGRDTDDWRFVTLSEGSVLVSPDTAGWELAVRRHHIIANGTLADLGAVPFTAVTRAPANGFVANTTSRDTTNSATRRWYRYGMLSHLLEPNGHVFAVHTSTNRHYKFEVLSYYCRGLEGGCLTIHFVPLAAP